MSAATAFSTAMPLYQHSAYELLRRRIIEGILDKEDHILKDTKLCGPGEAPKEEKKKPEGKGKKKRGVGVEASGDQETIEGLHGWRNRYQGKKFIPGKVVIFVIGGVCHAELQAAYELVSKYDLDVYIGGTAMMTGKVNCHYNVAVC